MLIETCLSVRYKEALVLKEVTLQIAAGEITGLAGQSGSGKSTLALALLRLLRWKGATAEGSLRIDGREMLPAPEREWRQIRGRKIALVMQSAESALNPALRLRQQLRLAWRIHAADWDKTGAGRAAELFAACGLPGDAEFLDRFPSNISIGQAQRVLIAMALLHRPALLVADEITSALDLLTQREVLDTLRKINQAYGTAILFVSHDLLALRSLCGTISILSNGGIVETQETEKLFRDPRHPYTQRLLAALPRFETECNSKLS
jgi:ABC-type dipeptide/oligopeptide/nickel transport system ATPase component